MPLIRPFPGLRPAAGRGGEVLAPPYDVLDTEEAREQARGRPWSFLHISKPEIDFPPGTDPHDPAVYRKAAANLEAMIEAGVLAQDPGPRYYVYRLEIEGHRQTGLVAAAAADAYESNRIRKHEHTRPDKEDDRVRQIEALGVQTGPALLAYRARDEVDALIGEGARGEPVIDETDAGGVRHRLWAVEDPALLERLTGAFEALDGLYIADGHHRSAAAARLAARRRARNPRHTGAEAYNYFLAVIFPHAQMRILDYNRVVRDLNGLEPEAFHEAVAERFTVQGEDRPVRPGGPGEFGMYLGGRWYRLRLPAERIPAEDPVARLDVSLLAEHLIAPVLGITDPRRDPRIGFVGGVRGLGELERRVDSGEMAVAFSLHPTRMEDLMAVADAGRVMPPKSTWFEPKLADGLVSHVID